MEVSVALNKRAYTPGELVKVLVKAHRPAAPGAVAGDPDGAAVRVTLECSGAERVDPGWVSSLYQPQQAATKDAKRLVRAVFSTGQLQLYSGTDWAPGTGRIFAARFRLPTRIPPSFRGSAVHFTYSAQAKATVAAAGAAAAAATPRPASGGAQHAAPAAAAAAAFTVWPKAERPPGAGGGGGGLEGRRPSLQQSGSLPLSPSAAAALSSASSLGGGGSAAFAAAASAAAAGEAGAEHLVEPDVVEYRLGAPEVKAKWEEVCIGPDGTLQTVVRQPPDGDPPSDQAQAGSPEQQSGSPEQRPAAAAAAAAAVEDDPLSDAAPPDGAGRLTAQQRASMLPRTYNLRAGDYGLLRVTVQPPLDTPLQPGATFGVFLDLRPSQAAAAAAAAAAGAGKPAGPPPSVCLAVAALLQSEEEVHAPYARRGAGAAAASAPSSAAAAAAGGGGAVAMRTLHAEQHLVTAHLLTGQFTLSIPPRAAPSFRTPLVSHRWTLHFELSLGPAAGAAGGGKGGKGPGVEQLLWSLPLVVCPPGP